MALTPWPYLLQLPLHSSPHSAQLFYSQSRKAEASLVSPIPVKLSVSVSPRPKCFRSATEEDRFSDPETISDDEDRPHDEVPVNSRHQTTTTAATSGGSGRVAMSSAGDSLLGIREPVYEVEEVKANGTISVRKINRRQLLKSSGLRPRDIRSVDPSLFLTNSMPSLLVREHAILLNLGSLRAIAMQERVLIFDYNNTGSRAFIEALLPRLNPKNMNGGPSMPFELEVVEAALLSRIQRLEQRLIYLEPRVQKLLSVLPNRLTADILEELRISKQTLVELGSRAGAFRQVLFDLLEDPHEIRRICIMGRNCTLKKINDDMECSVPLEKQIAEEEEEEIEMLLENYLQRCESCHGQAERLLDSAKEMEDSIAVNLSSRRLEVSRVELLLQVGTFCVALGALVAGIFGMNLRSYLEEHVFAFWFTTAGILVGAVVGFFLVYSYLRTRKVL
ncbi:magnesium transporter MRS2-11, chloroplastic-like [Malus sylvestris]|uniref:magnesium transporter MRS2-11, chloroplastic-like n=1 Tax=Malus sylvestris TaxID=3752 RepID=UPI0021AC1CAF|nr:magnesium transporter MRS2-11, chloroplastic-like [Malus sylvestris]